VGTAAAALPAGAEAKAPCRNRIFDDWYRDGKIASTYPLGCYRDALRHIPLDAKVYSSLVDDIKSALQAAIQRSHGKSVPAQVGHGPALVSSTNPSKRGDASHSEKHQGTTTTTSSSAPAETDAATPVASTDSGGVPTPVLVLGVLALALIVLGAAGMGVRRFRRAS
jgi:hypothetical protein